MVAHINNVSKKIRDKEVIKSISFSLFENEIVALVGPNGAGKTTLLKLIATLLNLDNGEIKVNGKDIKKDRINYLKEIAFMQDSSVLYQNLSGYDHLKFIAKLNNKHKDFILNIVNTLNIEGYIYKKVNSYSLGMKQHLLIAMALLSQPRILLLDEPLNGLDPTSSILLRKILLDIKRQGTTVLFSSHILNEVDKVSDRIIFIREGEIVYESEGAERVNSYTFEISNSEKIILEIKNKPYVLDLKSDLNKTKTSVFVKEEGLMDFLKYISESNIHVYNINKHENHSESIYKKIYEEQI